MKLIVSSKTSALPYMENIYNHKNEDTYNNSPSASNSDVRI